MFDLLVSILPEKLPVRTQLLPNYPNPFNPETWIPFELSQDSGVQLTIYDVVGNLVRVISVGYVQAGSYVGQSRAIYWDGKTDSGESVASGTYFYTLVAFVAQKLRTLRGGGQNCKIYSCLSSHAIVFIEFFICKLL